VVEEREDVRAAAPQGAVELGRSLLVRRAHHGGLK
jgi:hypothetical protein